MDSETDDRLPLAQRHYDGELGELTYDTVFDARSVPPHPWMRT